MTTFFLREPLIIPKVGGWADLILFVIGKDPQPDDLTGYSAAAILTKIGLPAIDPITLSTETGEITITGNSVNFAIDESVTEDWEFGDYAFQLEVTGPDVEIARYVVLSNELNRARVVGPT